MPKKIIPYNRWVLITGCDSGFGYKTALDLHTQGFGVIAICLTSQGCKRLEEETQKSLRMEPLHCDITSPPDLEKVKVCLTHHDPTQLWGVVNNAGIAIPGFFDLLKTDDFRKVMEVNFFGTLQIIEICLPYLKQSKGRIVNLSSTCGLVALAGNAPYNASKFAIRALNDTLRRELKSWGIKVWMVAPGVMNTPITHQYGLTFAEKFKTAQDSIQKEYGDDYRDYFLTDTQKKMDKMMQNPQKTVKAIIHAITARNPKNLYLPGKDAKFMFYPLSKRSASYVDRLFTFGSQKKPVHISTHGTKIFEFGLKCAGSPEKVWNIFLKECWIKGAGLTPKMIIENEGDDTGNQCTRWIPTFMKKGIRERIKKTEYPHRIYYQVDNPSWKTFPVNFHTGQIDFLEVESEFTYVIWRIELTPKTGAKWLVKKFIQLAIPMYLRALQKATKKNNE